MNSAEIIANNEFKNVDGLRIDMTIFCYLKSIINYKDESDVKLLADRMCKLYLKLINFDIINSSIDIFNEMNRINTEYECSICTIDNGVYFTSKTNSSESYFQPF